MTPFFECMTLGFNGSVVELKEGMTKVMRALRTLESATLDGQRIYYNHMRPHQGLVSRITNPYSYDSCSAGREDLSSYQISGMGTRKWFKS
jgi:hypothetical protein